MTVFLAFVCLLVRDLVGILLQFKLMTVKKSLTLSLIIPVYNEEHHIERCLLGVMNQTVKPFEIIIVDNNCTDKTIQLALKYKGVKIVKQPKQGRGWARTAGFNAASGDIIGRIDADSKLASNWVQLAIDQFSNNPDVMGITGIGKMVLLPRISFVRSTYWSRAYYWFAQASFRTVTMWGANMAIQKSAWNSVKNKVSNNDAVVHEDQDLSLCMAAKGLLIKEVNTLRISTFGQTYHYFPKLLQYLSLERSTIARHKSLGTFASPKLRKLSFWHVVPGVIYGFVPGVIIIVLSAFLWPLDELMILLGKRKSWLN